MVFTSRWFSFLYLWLLLPSLLASQTEFQLAESVKYIEGDDPAYASPDYDDSSWTELPRNKVPRAEFFGVSWVRTTLKVEPGPEGRMLGFHRWRIIGAATVFLNGREIFSVGRPGESIEEETSILQREPLFATLGKPWQVAPDGKYIYQIAVRHSNWIISEPPWEGMLTEGMRFEVGSHQSVSQSYHAHLKHRLTHQWIILGIVLTFAMIHFLLFVFYPKERSNLYFALMASSWSVLAFNGFYDPVTYPNFYNLHISTILATATMIFFTVAMGHSLSLNKVSPVLWVFLALCIIYALHGWFYPLVSTPDLWLLILMLVELVRVGMYGQRDDAINEAWIIGLGAIPISLLTIYSFLNEILNLDLPRLPGFYFLYAILCLLFSMSVFLAYRMAKFRKSLEAQIITIKELSEENLKQELERVKLQTEHDRKSLELEAARDFQLSMLPKLMPDHPSIELAATMSTATEVGGDYYDVFVGEDQTLTCVVGDATGHGLQAGTFVAGTKTLFNALAQEPDARAFLQQMSRSLKMMGLRKMFMALTFVRFQEGKLTLAAAGMPFALHYIAATGDVEEIKLKAPPLASLPTFPYQTVELPMAKGDAVLIFSDGLPERFNPQEAMFGEDRMKQLFAENASVPPDELLARLVEAGETWGEGRVQDDDITLFALKHK
jgi:serine phosphatase RsbU (regulator of sigma subunit)